MYIHLEVGDQEVEEAQVLKRPWVLNEAVKIETLVLWNKLGFCFLP